MVQRVIELHCRCTQACMLRLLPMGGPLLTRHAPIKASPAQYRPNHPPCADTVSVVGITASGQRVPGANKLAMRTPQEGAPTVAVATATSATQATVRLTPPTNGQVPSLYFVSLCLKAQPTNCVKQNSTSIQLSFTGLTAGANYIASATAKIGSTVVPASNTLPLAMPQRGAPILLTAVATTALTGAATAAAPNGVTFSKVSRQSLQFALPPWGWCIKRSPTQLLC